MNRTPRWPMSMKIRMVFRLTILRLPHGQPLMIHGKQSLLNLPFPFPVAMPQTRPLRTIHTLFLSIAQGHVEVRPFLEQPGHGLTAAERANPDLCQEYYMIICLAGNAVRSCVDSRIPWQRGRSLGDRGLRTGKHVITFAV